MKSTGICAIGCYVPVRRLSVEETISSWKNASTKLLKGNFGVTSRAVLNSDEDVVTMANEAVKSASDSKSFDLSSIDAVYFGTVTASDLFRGGSNLLMESLTGNKNYFSSDISSGENSGLAALIMGYASTSAGLHESTLAIGSDVLCRHTAPGDLREAYMGAGASAVIIGQKDTIATIEGVTSFNSNFPEIGRTEDERFIRELMPMDAGLLKVGVYDHLQHAIHAYCKKYKKSLEDFDYIILPQQYPGETKALAKMLNVEQKKIDSSIFSSNIGDTGSAASLIALQKVLEISKPNQSILVCGYAHNSGADVVGLKVTENIIDYQKNINKSVSAMTTELTIDVGYAEAMRLEYKFVGPNISIGTFN